MLESTKWQPFAISWHGITLNQIRMNRQNRARLLFTRMPIHRCFPLSANGCFILRAVSLFCDINDIIARTRQLDLRKIMDEIVIASMRIDDDDLLESVARNLTTGTLKQANCQLWFNTDTARIMPRFQNLREYKIWKNNRRFQRRSAITYFAANEHIRCEWQMMAVTLDTG